LKDLKNDCLDFSKSKIEIDNLKVNKAGDKAVSAGEKSNVRVKEAEIENVFIGFASKDNSQLRIDKANVANAFYGLAVYQKKAEFGPSFAEVYFLGISNVSEMFFIEKGSSVWHNWARIEGDKKGVFKTLYPNIK
jgi:hypothetical protein